MKVLTGNSGEVWFNATRASTLKSIEVKLTGNFEDVNFCGDNATHSAYTGYAGEGTMTILKEDSEIMAMIAESYASGEMPEIKITTKLMNGTTKRAERVAISEIVVTEVMLAKFEAKTIVEQEIPFKFAQYEVLETL